MRVPLAVALVALAIAAGAAGCLKTEDQGDEPAQGRAPNPFERESAPRRPHLESAAQPGDVRGSGGTADGGWSDR